MKQLFLVIPLVIALTDIRGLQGETITKDDNLQSFIRQAFASMSEQIHALKDTVRELDDKLTVQQNELDQVKSENRELKSHHDGKAAVFPRTCLELLESDPSAANGLHYIDPDGSNSGDPPIYVFCFSSGDTGITHDSANKINVGHCFDPGCYSRPVVYNATARQITALMELSSSCFQTIQYDCVSAPIAFNNVQYGWWNDRDGNPHYYWDGSEDLPHTCKCGIEGNCADPGLTCNCDASAPVPLLDAGTITNTNHLPISRLNFGRTSPDASSGEHTLGYMRCYGRYANAQNGRPTSCADLWRMSTTVSGIYLIQNDDGQVMTVYCNMTKLPGEEGQQGIIGYNDIKSSLVYFDAYRSSNLTSASSVVNYDVSYLNVGEAMDIKTGEFTAPKKGMYSFTFNGLAGTSGVRITIRINSRVWTAAEGLSGQSVSLNVLLSLNANDKIYVVLEAGSLFETRNGLFTHFHGYLVDEDL